MVTVCPSQFATRRTLFHVLVGCGLLMLKVSRLKLPVIWLLVDLSLRSSRSSYFATFRHQLTILSKTDALDEEKWLNMLGTFVKDWFRYESHFVHGRDSLVDILKE